MRILFIGNSHTYFNGMPFMVRHMLRQGGRPQAEVSMVAPDGRPLSWHVKEPTTRFAIRMHPWDRIVLQQQTVQESPGERPVLAAPSKQMRGCLADAFTPDVADVA